MYAGRRFGVVILPLLGLAGIGLATVAPAAMSPGELSRTPAAKRVLFLRMTEEELGRPNLFDLEGRTIRFEPADDGYRVEELGFTWDDDFGEEVLGVPSAKVGLRGFRFPFSGRHWTRLYVGVNGVLTFGKPQGAFYDPAENRFITMRDFAGEMIATTPIISVLFRPFQETSSERFVKIEADRVVVTWSVSEPWGHALTYITEPEWNLFQATLHSDGAVEVSYLEIQVDDGIVGLFPTTLDLGDGEILGVLDDPADDVAPHVDIRQVQLSRAASGLFLNFTIKLRGKPQSAKLAGDVGYTVWVDTDDPLVTGDANGDFGPADRADADLSWRIEPEGNHYSARGPGVVPRARVRGSEIAISVLVDALAGATELSFFADASDGDRGEGDDAAARAIEIDGSGTSIDLSAARGNDPANVLPMEAFFYRQASSAEELACKAIAKAGDRYDFMVWYSDFRVDSAEAATTSTGAIVSGIEGIGADSRDGSDFCTERLQAAHSQPVWIHGPYAAQEGVGEFGAFSDHAPQVGLIAHELGHRWFAFVDAQQGGRRVQLTDGPHWGFNVHAPTPYGPSERSGQYWVDNGDGTFNLATEGGDAPGFSYLDLYLMGLLHESDVPDFFVIENLRRSSGDVFSGDRVDVRVEDVIAAHGPRSPGFERSQKDFRVLFVGLYTTGKPSVYLRRNLKRLRKAFIKHFNEATGGVGRMR